MARRHPNPKLAKIHRTYNVDEAATLCGVHRNTVRQWIKRGLPCLDDQRPVLIQGQQLGAFLRAMRSTGKRPCQVDEIYCMACRLPRVPAQRQVIYSPMKPTQGNLIGMCPVCSSRMYRRVSFAKLALHAGQLQVAITQPRQHIAESPNLSVNSDFNPIQRTHATASAPQRADQAQILFLFEGGQAAR